MVAGALVFTSGREFVAGELVLAAAMPLVSPALELVDWASVELPGVF